MLKITLESSINMESIMKSKKNTTNAEIYFSESIEQKNDRVSMYNLAHLYIYENQTNESIDKSINLLIDSTDLEFYESARLLLIVLFKKYDGNLENVKNDLLRRNEEVYNLLFTEIEFNLFILFLSDEKQLEDMYQCYRSIDFLYNQFFEEIETSHLNDFKKNQKSQLYMQRKDITQDFYVGFGLEI